MDGLPNEVLVSVFKLLSPRHLKAAAVVSKRWKKVAEDRFIRRVAREHIIGD